MLQSPFSDRIEGSRATAAGKRPKLSLASLIGQAILAHEGHRARLSSIYEWISDRYPDYYRMNSGGWQNSIRHNLTINKAFIRLPKDDHEMPGKGSYWTISPEYIHQFKDGVFTGKIRASEYRSSVAVKYRSKRASTSDLPSLNEKIGSGYYSLDPEMTHSSQSLIESRYQNPEEYHDEFGYNGPPPIMPPRQGFMTVPPYPYFPPTVPNHQMFYNIGMMHQPNWHQGTIPEHVNDAQCECNYCISAAPSQPSLSPHPDHLPSILDVGAAQQQPYQYQPGAQNFYFPQPPQISYPNTHIQPFYSIASVNESEEQVMSNKFHGGKDNCGATEASVGCDVVQEN